MFELLSQKLKNKKGEPSPFIASDDYYLLAALNSKIADWYVRNF